ncbi:hypothetical protein HPB47_003102 [Ixodes persulcatus]|uniref:Uncharacterized protein n=1 Tax=Ixodes persulcatus TaxID=34615 RepID=A0AC60PKH1_IXOPE|nr:hypothetical protein HPB47_003102 [Ixodes persulcatus]
MSSSPSMTQHLPSIPPARPSIQPARPARKGEDGRAGTWLSRVKKEGTQIIQLIRRVTNRKWDTGKKDTRQLVQALFSSKVLYGYSYCYLTQRQCDTVDNLNSVAKHTWLPDLYAHGNFNKLKDEGQAILQEMGRLLSSEPKPPPLPPPPWERHVTLTADAPLPRRMDDERQIATLDPRRHVVYCTDAASGLVPAQGAPPTSAAWVNITRPNVWSQRLPPGCRHASKLTSDRVHKLCGIASRLYTNRHTQLRGVRGDEWAHNEARPALSRPSALIVPTIYSGPHFDSSQPDDTQPDLTERAALAKLERKKVHRNLRTADFLFNRHNRMMPPMPAGVSRKAQTLVRHATTNTLMLPTLRNRIFQDDPQQGYCTACSTLATTQHVIWECPEHAAARFEALADAPVARQPNTFEGWVIPQDKPPPTVLLLWNQICRFFCADCGPARLLPRSPSVTANSLE